jgi:hypothetical protein
VVSDLNLHRRAFWAFFAERLPELNARTERGNESSRWLAVGVMPLIAVHYISGESVGIFVRGARGTRIGHIREYLFPHREFLAKALGGQGLRLGENFLLGDRLKGSMLDVANWPRAIDWFAQRSPVYERALKALQRR